MVSMSAKIPSYQGRKFAVVSHILPPALSGQSILLDRLLREIEPSSYCLLSSGRDDASPAVGGLAGKTYRLRSALRIPILEIPLISWPFILFNALLGIFTRARQIEKIVRSEDCDLLIGCTGDLYDLPATWLASRWTGCPFIVYILDDYIFQWTGFRRRVAAWLEPKFVGAAQKIFVLNEFVRRFYAERYGVEPAVIHNPVCLPELKQLEQSVGDAGFNTVEIVYTGSIYHAHYDAFRNLVEVLNSGDPHRVQLHIYTSQPQGLLERQGITGPGVVFHPHIPQSEVFKVLRHADILFLPLAFHSPIPEVIRTSAPFKMSEYLAVGRPILVHAPADSFLSWYFRGNNCGLVVDCDDRQVLKAELDRFLMDETLEQTLATNARQRAEVDFDMDVIRPKFFALLNQVVAGPGPGR